jgi:thioredoxin 1
MHLMVHRPFPGERSLAGGPAIILWVATFVGPTSGRQHMASADVKEIGDGDFKREVLESAQPVLVDFWATWCAPCRAIAPYVEELATQYKGSLKVAKMNIDDNQDTPQQYGIRSIPTLLVFKGGKVVEQIVGAVPKAKLEAAVTKVI